MIAKPPPAFSGSTSVALLKRGRWARIPWALVMCVSNTIGALVGVVLGLALVVVLFFGRNVWLAIGGAFESIFDNFPWRAVRDFYGAGWRYAMQRRTYLPQPIWRKRWKFF